MSLIEEALRKQQLETDQVQSKEGSTPAETEEPAAPVSDESTSPAPEPPAGKRLWLTAVWIIGLAIVLTSVGVYLVYAGVRLWRTPDRNTKGPQGVVTTGATNRLTSPNATVALTPATPTGITAQAIAPTASTSLDTQALTQVTASPVSPTITNTVLPHASSAPATNNSQATTVAIPTVSPATSTPVPAVKVSVIWPRLTVSGILGNGRQGRGAARINNQTLSSGDTVEGVKVLSVTRQGVNLQYEGETRVLKAGDSTE